MHVNPVRICLWWQQDVTGESTGAGVRQQREEGQYPGSAEVRPGAVCADTWTRPLILVLSLLFSFRNQPSPASPPDYKAKDAFSTVAPKSTVMEGLSQNSQKHHIQMSRIWPKDSELSLV